MKVRENFRVVADVDDTYTYERDPQKREKAIANRAEDLKKAIERHCDGIQGYASVKWDVICSYCGNVWEEFENGEPACCGKAQEEWRLESKQPEAAQVAVATKEEVK